MDTYKTAKGRIWRTEENTHDTQKGGGWGRRRRITQQRGGTRPCTAAGGDQFEPLTPTFPGCYLMISPRLFVIQNFSIECYKNPISVNE